MQAKPDINNKHKQGLLTWMCLLNIISYSIFIAKLLRCKLRDGFEVFAEMTLGAKSKVGRNLTI
ncbi:hypothetical protein D1872_271030 [compost metagenome]